MQKINLHQKKLLSLVEALAAFIALLLPWTKYKVGQTLNMYDMYGIGGGGGGAIDSDNGFRSWGWLVVVGIVGVIICSILRDANKDYDKQTRIGVIISFALIAIGALLYFLALNSTGALQDPYGRPVTVSAGMGLWTALLAGVVGILWVTGILEQLSAKNNATPPAAPPAAPPTAPPPATA